MPVYEKALDIALAESKLLITLSSAFLTLSVSILKLVTSLPAYSVGFLIAAILLSVFSAIAGAAFLGAVTSFLRKARARESGCVVCMDRTYRDALNDSTVKRVLQIQWVLFAAGILMLGLSIV